MSKQRRTIHPGRLGEPEFPVAAERRVRWRAHHQHHTKEVMKDQKKPSDQFPRSPRFRSGALGLLLLAAPATVADPATLGGLTVASVLTFIGTVAGTVSMFSNLGTYRGDVEEQQTKLKLKNYSDQCSGLYGGVMWTHNRNFWVDYNGASQYRVTLVCRYRDGTTEWHTQMESFEHAIEQRDYYCAPQLGYWYRVVSRTQLTVGYDVTKPARMAQHFAPNPLPVTIHWRGTCLQTSCNDSPEQVWQAKREVLAPRRSYKALPFPRSNFEVDLVRTTLTPRITQ